MITNHLYIKQFKAPLLGLLLFFASSAMQAQTTQFNEPIRESTRIQSILESNGQYFGVGQFYQIATNRYSVNLLQFDATGAIVKEKRIIDSTQTFFPSNHISLVKTFDGNFVTTIDNALGPSTKNGILKFDSNLDTLWLRYPALSANVRPIYQIKQLPDSGFILTGLTYVAAKSRYDANLVRTNKHGVLLWEKIFQEPDSISLYPFHVYPTPDGGFLMAGSKLYLPDQQTANPLLMRTDSAGNLLWQKTYGGNQIDGIACAAYRDDGNIMIHYSQSFAKTAGGSKYFPVYSIIDDMTGQEIVKKNYPFIKIRNLMSHHLIKNGSKFIAVGRLAHQDTNLAGGVVQAYTLAIDENLNDLWFRYYNGQGVNAPPDDWSVLYDLRPTSDGGYIAGGYFTTFDTTHVNVHLGYNGWIVKMDSMGCAIPSCVNRIGVEEVITEKEELNIFPNPVQTTLTIAADKLPPKTTLQLLDIRGTVWHEQRLTAAHTTLSVEAYPVGLYFVRLQAPSGHSQTHKLVIAR